MNYLRESKDGYNSVQSQLPPEYTLVDENIITAKLKEVSLRTGYSNSNLAADFTKISKYPYCEVFNIDILNYKAFKLKNKKPWEDFSTEKTVGNRLKQGVNFLAQNTGHNREFGIYEYDKFKYTNNDKLEDTQPYTIVVSQCTISITNPNAGWFTNAPKYYSLNEFLKQYVLAIPTPIPTQGGKSRRKRRKKRVSRKNRRSRKTTSL